ncbi:MAG TPA: T9SS type A sorting domain-containing protein [Ignavibacteriaceae bacterium]|nr:T9SS type A sorting domain-containing protein [Ignavibacteriaceae bacterium]
MKYYLLLFLFTFCAFNINAQSWTSQVSGTTNTLRHVHFIDANTGWANGSGGILLKTTNGGTNWFTQSSGGNLTVGCYFINSSTGWIAGDDGVYKTTDGGATLNLQSGPNSTTKVFFLNQNIGWAVGGVDGTTPVAGYIFKTTNGGNTWTEQTNNTTWSRFYGVQFVNENTGWVYTESNNLLLKTTNGGNDWQQQLSFGTTKMIRGMYWLNQNTGWLVGRTATTGLILKTTDGGANWNEYGTNLPYGLSSVKFFDELKGFATASNQTTHGVASTTDGGLTWTFNQIATNGLTSLHFPDVNNGWAVGANGQIYKYNSGISAVEVSTIIPCSFSLSQNYPNPFNPSTRINFSVPSESIVNICIYDITGANILELINEIKAEGNYDISFTGNNLPSGLYFLRMQAGSFTKTIKMSLLK